MGELQELLSEAEDRYFKLKNGGLTAVEQLFWHEGCSHSFSFILAKLDMDDGQLLANDEIFATTGSNVKTRTVNKLKMRSKTGKVASVGF